MPSPTPTVAVPSSAAAPSPAAALSSAAAFEFTPRLRLAIARLTRLLRQYADPEATMSQSLVSALATVARAGPVTLGRLAELERVQPPSMTRIAARLEEQGMVARELDPADRRVSLVRTTPAGETYLSQVRTRKNEFLASRLGELSPAELAAIERALPAIEHLAGLS